MHQTTWAKSRCGWIGLWGDQRTWPRPADSGQDAALQKLDHDFIPGVIDLPGICHKSMLADRALEPAETWLRRLKSVHTEVSGLQWAMLDGRNPNTQNYTDSHIGRSADAAVSVPEARIPVYFRVVSILLSHFSKPKCPWIKTQSSLLETYFQILRLLRSK